MDEDQAMILLNSLLNGYEHFVDALKYDRQTLKLEQILATTNIKDEKKKEWQIE